MQKPPEKAKEEMASTASGITRSERYLAFLARKSFLSMWSYMNLHTDEGRKNGKGDGKELCDLLVVFDKHILIFSDKHCQFPTTDKVEVNWGRWFKKTVIKSANQLIGAREWLKRYPNRVFLDKQCTKPFPLPIPDLSEAKVHLFAVTRGSHDACRSFFGGQSTGSLMINTGLKGKDHFDIPFRIGHVIPDRGFIHVLDELTLEVLIHELDTISDFVAYISKKEKLLTDPDRMIMASGEEQLVAMYLTRLNQRKEHDFIDIPSDVDCAMIDEGIWEDFIRNPQYIAKKEADKVSYVWDRLVERFTKNVLAGKLDNPISTEIAYHEQALRFMAAEPRIRRRQLGEALVDAAHKSAPGKKFVRMVLSNDYPDTVYIFLILPVPEFASSYHEYRQARKNLLLAYCNVAKLKVPSAKQIFGFASEPVPAGNEKRATSEDILLLGVSESEWTPEREAEAKKDQQELRLFLNQNIQYRATHTSEYPEIKKEAGPFITRQGNLPLNRAQRRAMERNKRKK